MNEELFLDPGVLFHHSPGCWSKWMHNRLLITLLYMIYHCFFICVSRHSIHWQSIACEVKVIAINAKAFSLASLKIT